MSFANDWCVFCRDKLKEQLQQLQDKETEDSEDSEEGSEDNWYLTYNS